MPSLKRKPIIYHPLPSLSTILQPLQPLPTLPTLPNPSSPSTSTSTPNPTPPIPPDMETEEEQHALLTQILEGKYPGVLLLSERKGGRKSLASKSKAPIEGYMGGEGVWIPPNDGGGIGVGPVTATATLNTYLPSPGMNGGGEIGGNDIGQMGGGGAVNGHGVGIGELGHGGGGEDVKYWKVNDRDCWSIAQTGEIFTDYDTYASRIAFYQLHIFMCDATGKQNLSYFAAHASEQKEARQLHSRFPKQLKRAVLASVQFQIEGKLDALADKVHDRFVNRFFDEERVFINVQGDKYLAQIIKTFPPKALIPPPTTMIPHLPTHPYAVDLELSNEEVLERGDDPGGYFYNVRLIMEGEGQGGGVDGGEGSWGGSVMEVRAEQISRDRLNFSRTMLKRYIRDCVHRDPAVYSPWLLKPSVAAHYSLPLEMSDEVRARVSNYRERQMDKRKREREERMAGGMVEEEIAEEEKPRLGKKIKVKKEKGVGVEKEEVVEVKVKRIVKFPAEDLLVEWEEGAGREEVRPIPGKNLPFGEMFEKFIMSWSFLNAMGKPLGLSPFTLDDYEQSLNHTDPLNPSPLLTEIHATLLNALINDSKLTPLPLQPPSSSQSDSDETDYWEGLKGATTETLRPIASSLASTWKTTPLPLNRKGWESHLVGCLWERANLTSLPHYLDDILHLILEDKPVPTRPTWSTGPASGAAGGFVPAKPERRYATLGKKDKLGIVGWLCEIVGGLGVIREFLEESVAELTEVRKEQVEVKREWKRVVAEIEALEPKKEKNNTAEVDIEGDIIMDRAISPTASGIINGTNTERDELEDSPSENLDDNPSTIPFPPSTSASRQKALKEKAAEREASQSIKTLQLAQETKTKSESKHLTTERKRLADEEGVLKSKLRELEYEFRSWFYTLRARPLGVDRFGNRVWWFDGIGSCGLGEIGRARTWGTGRVFVQGVEEGEGEWLRVNANGLGYHQVGVGEVESRRVREEGEGRLGSGEWGVYDTPEQLEGFVDWLSPKGTREAGLLKVMRQWMPEIMGGMHRRRVVAGLEEMGEGEEIAAAGVKRRSTRKVPGGEEEGVGHMGWRNRRANEK